MKHLSNEVRRKMSALKVRTPYSGMPYSDYYCNTHVGLHTYGVHIYGLIILKAPKILMEDNTLYAKIKTFISRAYSSLTSKL